MILEDGMDILSRKAGNQLQT